MSNPFARNEGNAQGFGQQGGYPGVAQGGYQQGYGQQGGYAPGQYQGGFPQAPNNTNPSAAPTQGNGTGANGMLSMTPYGATNLYEITDISYGPKADNNA